MQTSRVLSSFLKNRFSGSFNLLKRRFHSTSYVRSAHPRHVPITRHDPVVSASWRSYIFPGAVLGGVGGLALFLHYNDKRATIPKGQRVECERSSNQGSITGCPFSLIDTEGRVVTEQNFLGNWVLLYFGYTSSPEVGPVELQKMSKMIDILGSKQDCKILPVFVSIDPQRDTPSHLRAYIKEIDPRIVGLTGPVTAVRRMAQQYRVFFRKVDEEGGDYLVESCDNMYLMNPKMEVVTCFGLEYDAEDLAEAIDRELKKAGNRHTGID